MTSLFHNESSCETFSLKMNLIDMKMNIQVKNTIIQMVRKTRFDVEAKSDSENIDSKIYAGSLDK